MKIIFYNYQQFVDYKNIQININKPKKQKLILQESLMNGYYNIFKHNNKIINIYRNSIPLNNHPIFQINSECNKWKHSTILLQNNDKKIILNGKCSSHNFCPIITPDNKIFGIGGLHSNPKYHTKCFKNKNITHKGKQIKSPNEYHPCHCNGLYLFKSDDFNNWGLVQKLPVLSGIHKGQFDNRWGWSEFDGKISCFYSKIKKKYLIYVRSNIKNRVRWVQMSESPDLINWSPFQLLTVTPKFNKEKDNYYHLDVMEYPETNLFIGLSPYSDGTEQNSYIALLFSKDGLNWHRSGKFMDSPLGYRDGKKTKHNSIHTTGVFIPENNKFDFYFNENYCGHSNRKKSEIVKYSLDKDRIIGLKSQNGSFKIKIKKSKKLILNFKGYLKINEHELNGDFLNKEVEILETDILKCKLKGEIYSIVT